MDEELSDSDRRFQLRGMLILFCLIALGSLAFARRADTVRAATMLCWLGAAISAAITIWWFMIQNGPSPLAISVVFFVVAATSMGKLRNPGPT